MAIIHFIPENKTVSVADGTNLLEAARKADVLIDAPCDGTGTCGKWSGDPAVGHHRCRKPRTIG